MNSLNVQFMTMLTMICGGFYLGMALDTFRRFSIYWRRPVWLLYTIEVLFWLIQTVILFYLLFTANQGEIRMYIFAAALLGFAAYQALAKKVYRQLLEYLIRIISAIIRVFVNIVRILIIVPIKGLITIVLAVLLFLIQAVLTIVGFILKIILLPFKWIFAIVWRLLPKSAKNFVHKYQGLYSTMKESCIKCLKWIKLKRR